MRPWHYIAGGLAILAVLASRTDKAQEVITAAGDAMGDGKQHLDGDTLARAAGLKNPAKAHQIIDSMNAAADYASINTPRRWAMFIAQTAHESNGFTVTEENLRYSADGIWATFGENYFLPNELDAFARQPEKIANRVYSDRMGNGDEASGDGWLYRGRGFIQITGKDSYAAMSRDLAVDFLGQPDLAKSPGYAALTAGWFWKAHNLNAASDAGDVTRATHIINGGVNGLADRQRRYDAALAVLDPSTGANA